MVLIPLTNPPPPADTAAMVRTPRRTRAGLTLVELLVVLGIVAILLAIALPTLARVRQSARTTACAANLRQIDAALQGYASDNNGVVYPPIDGSYAWWERVPGLGDAYAKRSDTGYPALDDVYMRCPEAPAAGFLSGMSNVPDQWIDTHTYLLNRYLETLDVRRTGGRTGQLDQKDIVVMGESSFVNNTKGSIWMQPGSFEHVELRRHGEGSNYLFLDGSVRHEPPWPAPPGAADPWDIPLDRPTGSEIRWW